MMRLNPTIMNTANDKSKRPSGPSTGTARPVLMMTGQKGLIIMTKRDKKAPNKKTTGKSRKSDMNYIKLQEVESEVQIETGEMWLKSGKYNAPSVSVKIDPDKIMSDWMRKITLRNVVLTVEENDKGYPELVISGQEDEDDDDDAGDE